jgi:anti-sigma factor RsiW
MTGGPLHLPDALLEHYLAGALDESAREQVEARLQQSAAARSRLEELRADSAAFLSRNPPGPLVARLMREHPRGRRRA